jgi:hypothetical protein
MMTSSFGRALKGVAAVSVLTIAMSGCSGDQLTDLLDSLFGGEAEAPELSDTTAEPEPIGSDEPEATEPEVTEPEVTEPEVTEPEVTEPEVTEPEVTEPEADGEAPSKPGCGSSFDPNGSGDSGDSGAGEEQSPAIPDVPPASPAELTTSCGS